MARWMSGRSRRRPGTQRVVGAQELPMEPRGHRPSNGLSGPPHPWKLWLEALDDAMSPSDIDLKKYVPQNARARLKVPYLKGVREKVEFKVAAQRQRILPLGLNMFSLLLMRRICKPTGKGKKFRFNSFVVVGNGEGTVGVGIGKHTTHTESVKKATKAAVRNVVHVPLYDNRTLLHTSDVKYHCTRLRLWPRPPGFGVRSNTLTREIFRCAGILDATVTRTRSNNKMCTIFATMRILQQQREIGDIARARGLRIYDVRKLAFGTVVE